MMIDPDDIPSIPLPLRLWDTTHRPRHGPTTDPIDLDGSWRRIRAHPNERVLEVLDA